MSRQEGIDKVGFASVNIQDAHKDNLKKYIENSSCASMYWIARSFYQRIDPKRYWSDASSIVVFGLNYNVEYSGMKNEEFALKDKSYRGNYRFLKISQYAKNVDYHKFLHKRIKKIAHVAKKEFGVGYKICVDSSPVMEKPFAQNANMGWQGKHTNLVSVDYGSWLFLGCLFLDIDIVCNDSFLVGEKIDKKKLPVASCGSCTRCVDCCPTKAIKNYKIDSNRCISYLTIEYDGHFDRDIRPLIGNYIYGCDECLRICPWNKFARESSLLKSTYRDDLNDIAIDVYLSMDTALFNKLFSKTPIKRIGRDKMLRNVLIAVANLKFLARKERRLVYRLTYDESSIVKVAAIWCLRMHVSSALFKSIARIRAITENDIFAKNEWMDLL